MKIYYIAMTGAIIFLVGMVTICIGMAVNYGYQKGYMEGRAQSSETIYLPPGTFDLGGCTFKLGSNTTLIGDPSDRTIMVSTTTMPRLDLPFDNEVKI